MCCVVVCGVVWCGVVACGGVVMYGVVWCGGVVVVDDALNLFFMCVFWISPITLTLFFTKTVRHPNSLLVFSWTETHF